MNAKPVSHAGLGRENLEKILRQCRHVVISNPPTFDLRHYLVLRLHDENPDLADKIDAMSNAEIDQLAGSIGSYQSWFR